MILTKLGKTMAGAGLGVLLVASALFMLLQIENPYIKPSNYGDVDPKDDEVVMPQVDEVDPLLEAVAVNLASVEMPEPPAKKHKTTSPPKPVNEAPTPKENPPVESVAREDNPKQLAIKATFVATVQPTTLLLEKGKALMEIPEHGEKIPAVYGDFSQLGFSEYAKAVRKSGGKLVVYDVSGQYGFIPLVELSDQYRPQTQNLAGYYIERPRLLSKPYTKKINNVIMELSSRYPGADLQPGFVLTKRAEYFILGAVEKILQQNLYEYEALWGYYSKDNQGKLIFTINHAKRQGNTRKKTLPQAIRVNFANIG